jgi:hypothetical protein
MSILDRLFIGLTALVSAVLVFILLSAVLT